MLRALLKFLRIVLFRYVEPDKVYGFRVTYMGDKASPAQKLDQLENYHYHVVGRVAGSRTALDLDFERFIAIQRRKYRRELMPNGILREHDHSAFARHSYGLPPMNYIDGCPVPGRYAQKRLPAPV